jgi:hypothetical protein
VVNTSEQAIDVELLWLASGLIDRAVTRPLQALIVPAKTSVPVRLDLNDLPVQSHEAATMATFVARYTTPEGHAAQNHANARFVTYSPGYAQATVRSLARQSALGAEQLRQPPPTHRVRGRYYDPALDQLVEDESWKEAEKAAVYEIASGFADVELPEVIEPEVERPSAIGQKASSLSICPFWRYMFRDQGNGEDFLRHNTGQTFGDFAAKRTLIRINNAVTLFTSSGGCTSPISLAPGTYTVSMFPSMTRENRSISVFPTSARQARAYTSTIVVQADRNHTLIMNKGLNDPVAAAAAISTHLLDLSDIGGLAAQQYRIYAEEQCPPSLPTCGEPLVGTSACTQLLPNSGPEVFLGPDNSGGWRAFSKFVVAHELGHAMAFVAIGFLGGDYCEVVPEDELLCRCDFVTVSNKLHCLNSREKIAPAQTEAFAHFYAANMMNRRTENSCVFTYYKEMITPFTIAQPPFPVQCNIMSQWRDNFCAKNDTGVGIDWLPFYWRLTSDSGAASARRFALADFVNLYREACGNARCVGQQPKFADLVAAARREFGTNHAKTLFLIEAGAAAGIDNN